MTDGQTRPTTWARWIALLYQIIAAAAILLGFVWYLAGWRGSVDTRLENIERAVTRIDGRLDVLTRQLGRAAARNQPQVYTRPPQVLR